MKSLLSIMIAGVVLGGTVFVDHAEAGDKAMRKPPRRSPRRHLQRSRVHSRRRRPVLIASGTGSRA